ncbi:MAG: signal peptidase signal peptidase [Candidatus Nomurabacteria bacterium]|nr:signal peptidase signal peptidase [Candidatus Nomurabacteria bacterium]
MEQTTEHQDGPSVGPARKSFFQTGFGKFVENVLYIIGAVVCAAFIQAFIIRPFIVSGTSMDPIIQNGQYLIIDEVSYHIHEPERGDVIVFKAPPEPTKYYIKRIIGLPGDTVHLKDGKITITNAANPKGFTLSEPYLKHLSNDDGTFVVTPGNYFVMGDNRTGSYDSRSWGMLPEANIRGRALLRLLPVTTISVLPGKESYEQQ